MNISRKALVVGIDDYPGAHLNGCVRDAASVADILKKNYDGTPNFDIELHYDVKTKSDLIEHIKELFKGTNDIALFYFSGHGYFGELGGFIVTPDNKKNDMGVSMETLMKLASASKSKDRIIIADCCHSGQIGSTDVEEDRTMLGDGMTIMAACTRLETAKESNGHGVFTKLLVEGLKGGASDLSGNVSPGGLYAYIDRSLGPWDQRPVFKTNVSRFSSLREVRPPIEYEALISIEALFYSPESIIELNPSFEFTNSRDYKWETKEPFASQRNVDKFKKLQSLERAGLVVPVGEDHMYFAAMNSKSCKLTPLGQHYWNLIKRGLI